MDWRLFLLPAWLFFSFLSFGLPQSAKAQPTVPAADSLALVALYNATNGPGWTNNTNWLTGTVDTWHGITVFVGQVTQINLQQNQLQGTIPATLGELLDLTYLRLDSNALSGPIPPELGNLTNLNLFQLSDNQLTGSIPAELGNLSTLRSLYLHINQLEGPIPASLGNLSNLQVMLLGNNNLTGSIPAALGSLSNLIRLGLSANDLSGPIPTALANLTNLETLLLFENDLTGSIPSELGNLTNLESLRISDNQFDGAIPASLGNLSNLRTLNLSENKLTGAIPSSFGNLSNLELLYAYSNQLDGSLPASLVNLSQLRLLQVQNNQFTDVPDLSALPALERVSIHDNKLTFEDIEPLIDVGLTSYNYDPQALVGTPTSETVQEGESLTLHIPVGGANNEYQWFKDGSPIGGATTDTYVIASAALADAGSYTLQITNTLATALTLESHPISVTVIEGPSPIQQDSLALVTLYNATDGPNWNNNTNWLTGTVDTWHGITVAGGRVTSIELGGNQMQGILPSELGELTQLVELWMSGNDLTGAIPPELGNLSRLEKLYLAGNELSGPLPSSLGNLSKLKEVGMSSNQLQGALPAWLGTFPDLERLSLQRNQFTGPIPASLGNLTKLVSILLEENQLNGSIPASLGNLNSLYHFSAGNNQLSGSLPPEFAALSSLKFLLLGSNHLQGPIPSSWGNLPLEILHLFDNNLTGSVPPEIGNITSLESFNASSNQFTDLPEEIGNLTNLTSLSFAFNQLIGPIPASIGNLTKLTDLSLRENQLTGPIPASLGNLTKLRILLLEDNQLEGTLPIGSMHSLERLRFYQNQIDDLPDLSGATNLKSIDARWNHLTFEDLEPNLGLPSEEFLYSGQRPLVGVGEELVIDEGSTLSIHQPVGGANNVYAWRKDGVALSDADPSSDTYTITNATSEDTGYYQAFVTNTVVTGLTFHTAPVRVQVIPANTPPTVTITQGPTGAVGAGAIVFAWQGSDADGSIVGYEWELTGAELADGTTTSNTLTLEALPEGAYLFRIRAEDDAGAFSDWMERAFTVNPASAPQAQADAATTPEDTALPAIDVLGNDTDPDGTALSVTSVSNPQHGTAAINANGTISYTPDANFHGTDTFVYTVTDGDGMTAQGTVTITVTPVNDAPAFTSTPDETTAEGQVYAYTVTTTDVDADVLTLDAVTLPAWLALTDNTNTSALLTGTPMQADVGTHEVVLTITDGTETVEQAFVLTVTEANVPPPPPALTSLTDGSSLVLEGDPEAPFVVTWTAPVDPDGDPLTYRWELAMENTFASLLFSEDVGAATRFETTVGAIGALLRDAGVEIQTSITLFHRVVTSDGVNDIASDPAQITLTRGIITDTEISSGLPEQFTLLGNYPNPFNPETTIRVDMPEAAQVTVVLYDVLGREARRVEAGALSAGTGQTIRISAGDLSSGVYVYRVIGRLASGQVQTAVGRMTLLK